MARSRSGHKETHHRLARQRETRVLNHAQRVAKGVEHGAGQTAPAPRSGYHEPLPPPPPLSPPPPSKPPPPVSLEEVSS